MHKYKTMLSYCLKCRKNTDIKPKSSGKGNGKTMILLNLLYVAVKKSKFIKKQEANGLLGSLRIKVRLSKIPLVSPIFWMQFH